MGELSTAPASVVAHGRRLVLLDELAGAPREAAFGQLETSRAGLSAAEASTRLERDGANEFARAGRPLLSVLLGQLRSPLLGLLVAAATVSIAVGEQTSGAIILVIVALSVGLGVFNEYGSEQTLASLRNRTGRRATILRDGAAVEVQHPRRCASRQRLPQSPVESEQAGGHRPRAQRSPGRGVLRTVPSLAYRSQRANFLDTVRVPET